MTATAHCDAARRFRVLAQAEDCAGHLAQERGDAIGAADHLDAREFWHALADHHEQQAELKALSAVEHAPAIEGLTDGPVHVLHR